MCEFCTSHGEGKKWYENMANYTQEVFNQVSSEPELKTYMQGFLHSLKHTTAQGHKWRKRFPRIYDWLIYPRVTKHMKQTHFGQVVPLEDIERVLDNFSSVVRLPCICRKATLGQEKRWCFGVGHDLSHVYAEVPDFTPFDHVSIDEAKSIIRRLDAEGMVHSLWTFQTPYIGAICNCDHNCMAYRVQHTMAISKVMWKAEYVAEIDPLLCTGCRKCEKQCYFNALSFDSTNRKCSVIPEVCYGCGSCRVACDTKAITLFDRKLVPAAASSW